MHSQTSLVASQVRLQQWTEQIHDCQSRPKGMSIDEWCRHHSITKANYYYRLRKVREACLAVVEHTNVPAFVELTEPVHESVSIKTEVSNVSGILYGRNGIRIELFNSASSEFITNLIGVLSHAE